MDTVKDFLNGESGFQQSDVADLAGKTALVTGGTQGIGFEVAKALAVSRARVLLLSRKEENGEEAVKAIKEETSGAADIQFISCDLGNLNATREVADSIRNKEERLDIFVGDAGIGVNKYGIAFDGIERHFAVNNLGHILLVNRLLPLIRKTAMRNEYPAPRIVLLSSSLHATASSSVRFANVEEINDSSLGPNQLYSRSKLATLLFTRWLAKNVLNTSDVGGSHIYALASHPGAVHTGQQDQFKEAYGEMFGTMLKTVTVPFMRTPEQGSLSTLWAATSKEVEQKGLNGAYITDPGKWGGESMQGKNDDLGNALYSLASQIIEDKAGPAAFLDWKEIKQ